MEAAVEGEYPSNTAPEVHELLRSHPSDGPDTIQARLAETGYLFFPGLLPAEDVLKVRGDFVEILQAHDWIAPGQGALGTETTDDRFKIERLEGGSEYSPVMESFQQLEDFHALAQAPELIAALGLAYGEPAFAHPRNIGRIIFPQENDFKSQPHQDWFFIQGDQATLTAWIPLGDIPLTHGPLTVLSGSHAYGLRRHIPVSETTNIRGGAGGQTVLVKEMESAGCRWASTNYSAGDVLLFTSLTAHSALPNDSNEVRLSTDYRYCAASKPLVAASLLPHFGGLTWDQVYEGEYSSHGWVKPKWRSSLLKYYWKDGTPPIVAPLGSTGEDNHSVAAGGLRLSDPLPNELIDGAERAEVLRTTLDAELRGAKL